MKWTIDTQHIKNLCILYVNAPLYAPPLPYMLLPFSVCSSPSLYAPPLPCMLLPFPVCSSLSYMLLPFPVCSSPSLYAPPLPCMLLPPLYAPPLPCMLLPFSVCSSPSLYAPPFPYMPTCLAYPHLMLLHTYSSRLLIPLVIKINTILCCQMDYNRHQREVLCSLARQEIHTQQKMKELQSLDDEVMDWLKKYRLKKKTMSRKEKEGVWKLLERRSTLCDQLQSWPRLPPR